MQVVIRSDSSFQIGTGHVMRCLTLVQQLQAHGSEVTFVCRDLPGNIFSVIQDKGFKLIKLAYRKDIQQELNSLPEHQQWLGEHLSIEINTVFKILKAKNPIDLLVVDHYALDKFWETAMRPLVKKIMVIDDLADRKHDCEVLLDQNFYRDLEVRYNNLVPKHALKLLGPQYCLLREEFIKYRRQVPKKISVVKNILVNFGGGDKRNYCGKLLEIIRNNKSKFNEFEFTFLLGKNNHNSLKAIDSSSGLSNCKVLNYSNSMAELMIQCDLFIGAAGSTTLERAYLGVPSLVTIIAENQNKTALDGHGLFHHVINIKRESFICMFKDLVCNVKYINQLSENGYNLLKERKVDILKTLFLGDIFSGVKM